MNIYEKLQVIQARLKAPKDQYNSFGKYKYRNVESIYEAVKPLLSEVKATLTVSDVIEEVSGRFYIMSTATLTDCENPGDRVQAVAYAREAQDKKGMDDSQVTGSTSSYARKYALGGLLCIDSGEADADSWNAGSDQPKEREKPKAKAAPKQAEPQPASTATNEAEIDYIKEIVMRYEDRDFGGQLLKHYGVNGLNELTPEQLAKAVRQARSYDTARKAERESKESGN